MIGFKALDVHHQTAILGMEKLHQLTAATNEKMKYITVPDTASHTPVYHTAEGTDAPTHISLAGVEKYRIVSFKQNMAIGILVDQTGSCLFHTGTQMGTDAIKKQQGHSENGREGSNIACLDADGS